VALNKNKNNIIIIIIKTKIKTKNVPNLGSTSLLDAREEVRVEEIWVNVSCSLLASKSA
jgi:hypothetical protein